MPLQHTAEEECRPLTSRVAARGAEIFERYGPDIGWAELQRILADRRCARYPCDILFDAAPLRPGEFAQPVAKGARPEDGYTLHVHPAFMRQLDQVPLLVLHQLALVNYGQFAAPEDAETFAAHALGMLPNDYYTRVCLLADQVGGCK